MHIGIQAICVGIHFSNVPISDESNPLKWDTAGMLSQALSPRVKIRDMTLHNYKPFTIQ